MYNILVCDDDREIVEAIEIYLSKEGYNVTSLWWFGSNWNSQKRRYSIIVNWRNVPKLDALGQH